MGKLVVSNVSKAYKRYPGKWARVREWLTGKPCHDKTWVLRDINFTINPGEAVGIVGVNGAGKSTLLKIITGTTQPTSGSVQIEGRVAALLELGMGFHPDFTGRQNVFMAGQLLGYGLEEVARLMPEIEAFAGIGEYIDRPVRVYSSGMQVRLAFAVSTAVRPDVLIVDEALSVGDAAFQRKCFQRIEGYRVAGTTLLFVSHDIETIKKLCDRALFIKEGTLAQWGPAKQVCDEYERYLFGDRSSNTGESNNQKLLEATENALFDKSLTAACLISYGNGRAKISNLRFENLYGNCINVVQTGVNIFVVFDVEVGVEDIKYPCFNIQIKTADGVVIYGINTEHLKKNIQLLPNEKRQVSFELENRLAPNTYFLTCGLKEEGARSDIFCSRIVDGAILKVIDMDESTVARGIVDMRARFRIGCCS